MPRKRSKIILCKNCNKDTGWYRSNFCNDCVKEGWHRVRFKNAKPTSLRTVKEMVESQSHRTSSNKYNPIRLHARNRIKQLKIPLKCSNCNYDKHVEVCHIIPINTFAPETLVSVVNSDSNLSLLCPNCHWEFDNKLITVKSIHIDKILPVSG